MIFYFSATGNSKYLAYGLGERLGEEVRDIAEEIKGDCRYDLDRMVIVSPVYYYGPPTILSDFIAKMAFERVPAFYLVLNYGSTPGTAGDRFDSEMKKRGFAFKSRFEVQMPENYIPMFDVPEPEEIERQLDASDAFMDEAAGMISSGEGSIAADVTFSQRMLGHIARPFYEHGRGTHKFYVNSKCMKCGRCVKLCPIDAISFKDRSPKWDAKKCIRCLTCVHLCPYDAIEFGMSTRGKRRYCNPRIDPDRGKKKVR